jgi:hypothetical protein
MMASQGRGRFYTKHAKAAKEEAAKTGRRPTERDAYHPRKRMVRFGSDSLGWEEAER